MKKSNQILGLPIISISDGSEVGAVKSLVVNPDKGSVDFIIIEKEDWQVSVKAIPFKKIVGIGEYAVTVESDNAVIDLNEIPIANQLVNKKIKINGSKVMTRKGELLGEVIEYFIDEDNGQILGAALSVANREVIIASSSVITYGKEIIIVKENASNYFLDAPEQLIQDKARKEDLFQTELVDQSNQNNKTEENAANEKKMNENDPFKAIRDQQFELLKGKLTTKDLLDKDGTVLIPKGTVLDREEILKAQQLGPTGIIQLSMHVED
ncbi:PRC-barrel domain-containing protein [Calidifontibacillus erzurumensis]|uniref:PRC-barrel domain-containing protein n=1 Tax=Calidifontibacillus erzurumensis TaxID=2741433 RepID=UPI0035B50CF5